jgi:hypothetical protein
MYDPLAVERAKIRAEVSAELAKQADAEHKILDGQMRLSAISPAVAGASKGGISWAWAVLFAVAAAAIGFGAAAEDAPHGHHGSTLQWLVRAAQDASGH